MKPTSRITKIIDVSIIKKIELLAQQEKGVISLAQGIPSFFTAPHITRAAKKAIDMGKTDKYTPGFGIAPLREAVAKKLAKENKIYLSSQEIIITHGATEALMAIFMALFDPGDEVIILTPDYALHVCQVTIALGGAKPVFVPLTETKEGWILDPVRLKKAVTVKTKAILVCNPCNPTGKVYSKEELKEIAAVARKFDLYIISDEVYEHFVFDKKSHVSIGSFPEVADRVISVFSVSKSYAMTGWRIGYIASTKGLFEQIFKVHDSIITCPTGVSQYAALAALEGPNDVILSYKKSFEKRRKIVVEELAKTNKLTFCMPEGTYYCFPKFKKKVNVQSLALRMIKEAKVAVVPGSEFGTGGENHIRISFGAEEETLRKGLQRLVQFINTAKL